MKNYRGVMRKHCERTISTVIYAHASAFLCFYYQNLKNFKVRNLVIYF